MRSVPTLPRTRRTLAISATLAAVVLLASCYSSSQIKAATLIDDSRTARGLSSLTVSPEAMSKAQDWAVHMSRTGVLEHTGGGSRMSTAGLPRWCSAAENVAKASSTTAAHSKLMSSPGHRANILGPYNRVGTGVVRKGTVVWVVQIFFRAC